MGHSVTQLTQSRYYSPAFNAAVFDGPIRIYFAQHQEQLALKVYFRLQQHLKEGYQVFRQMFKQSGQTIFLMLYPTTDIFENSFSKKQSLIRVVSERLGEDHVLGVCGPLPDEDYSEVFNLVEAILQTLPRPELERVLEP
jgi:hypothetical protein